MRSDCPVCGKYCEYFGPSKIFFCEPCYSASFTSPLRYEVLLPLARSYVPEYWNPTRLFYTRPSSGKRFDGRWTMEEDVQRLRHLLPRITDKILCGPTDGPWPAIKAAINLESTERELRSK